jgi:hypothetical protein
VTGPEPEKTAAERIASLLAANGYSREAMPWSTDLAQPTVSGGNAVFRLLPGGKYERVSQE